MQVATRAPEGRALLLASLVAASIGLVSSGAAAHGVFPATERVALHPSDPATLVVQASFGVLVTEDAGATWGWICREPTGALDSEDPRIAVTDDRAIMFAVFGGILRGDDLGCSIAPPSPLLDGTVAIDLDRDSDGALYTVTSSGGTANSVYRSSDQGRTWAAAGPPIGEILFETLRVAPSDTSRIYLTGSVPPAAGAERIAWLFRSDDRGASFTRLDGPPLAGARNLFLLGIDGRNPERVLLVGPRAMADDSVYESIDGGATFHETVHLPEVRAFAADAATDTVWIGGRESTGLWRSVAGGAFEQVGPPLEVACLASRDGRLYTCANEYTDGWSLGVSTDAGATFTPLLTFDQVTHTRTCASPSPTHDVCVPLEPTQLEAVLRPATASARPPGCGCHLPGSGHAPGVLVALLGLVGASCRRSQRRRLRRVGPA